MNKEEIYQFGQRMFHKILWKNHRPQGICCFERITKHCLSQGVSDRIQATLIPQGTILECLCSQQKR